MTLLTATHARTLSLPEKFGSVPFFSSGRVTTLRTLLGVLDESGRASTTDPRVNYEWNTRVMGLSLSYVPQGPIDPFVNPASSPALRADAEAAVGLAVRYLVLGDEAAGSAAIRVLQAWSTISTFVNDSETGLYWSYRWPVYLQAALMLRDHPDYTPALHSALLDVTTRSLPLSQWLANNDNRGAWGVCFEIACGVFLEDRPRFDTAIRRWRSLFDDAIVNNIPVHEIYRQSGSDGDGSTGLWYSNFVLYALVVAAEWARFNGEWLYDYIGADGSTLRGLYDNVRHWTRYPQLYPYNSSGTPSQTVRNLPHDDILYTLWPTEEGAWLLANFPTGTDRDSFGMFGSVLAYRGRPLFG